jgi:helix-turn-helix protein
MTINNKNLKILRSIFKNIKKRQIDISPSSTKSKTLIILYSKINQLVLKQKNVININS